MLRHCLYVMTRAGRGQSVFALTPMHGRADPLQIPRQKLPQPLTVGAGQHLGRVAFFFNQALVQVVLPWRIVSNTVLDAFRRVYRRN